MRGRIDDPQALPRAARQAGRQNVWPARALIAGGAVSETLYYIALARHLGRPFEAGYPVLGSPAGPARAMASGRVQLHGAAERRWLVAPQDTTLRALLVAAATGTVPPDIVITSPSRLREIILLRCADIVAHRAAQALPDAAPTLSARRASRGPARLAIGVALAALVAGLGLAPRPTTDLLGAVFFSCLALRLLICAAALDQDVQPPPPLRDADLPTYTILVPLYRETDILAGLVEALARLDYPAAKLEAFFLVESDDAATRTALAALRLPSWAHVLPVPAGDGRPRTKPRALNVGLLFANGDLLTVFDAEDRPEREQLRVAAALFAARPGLACAQARLAITNGACGILPSLFAIEYAALFDLYNIGLAALGLPIPLGGTSNHFRTRVLREVGGWDAWNVTEDADLGLRLARFGHEITCIPSATAEEAPELLADWMQQRRRWTKGWMQTVLVLVGDVRAVRRDFGWGRFFLVVMMLANLVLSPLVLPLFSVCVLIQLAARGGTIAGPIAAGEAILAMSVLGLGLGSTLWAAFAGSRIRRPGVVAASLPLLLPYQLLTSAAAWWGLVDLLRRPFHWHKTTHGEAARRRRR